MLKTSIGLELVDGTLRIAAVRSFLNRRRLIGTYEIPGFESLSSSEQRRELSALRKKHRLSGSRVHLSLSHDAGLVRQLDLPSEVHDKLADVVRLQLDALSPWPVDEVYWAFSTPRPVRGVKTIVVTIVIIPKAVLDPRVELFRSAGLPLRGATIAAGAWAGGAATLWDGGRPVIVLGCEDGTVQGVVLSGRRFFTLADSGSDTVSTAREVSRRLLALARIGDPEGARLIVHGNSADALSDESSTALPLENAPHSAGRRFGPIAAALSALADGGFAPNALPPALRYRQSRMQMVPTWVVLALIGIALLASALREPYQSAQYASRIEREIERIAPEVADVASREEQLLAAERRFEALAGHVSGRDRNLEALAVLAESLPVTDWISSYRYEGNGVTISGLSEDTSRLQGILEADAVFEEVRFAGAVVADASGLSRFTLEMRLEAPR